MNRLSLSLVLLAVFVARADEACLARGRLVLVEKDRHFFGGETIKRTIAWEGEGQAPQRLSWCLVVASGIAAKGNFTLAEARKRTIEIPIPKVRVRMKAILEARGEAANLGRVALDTDIDIYPQGILANLRKVTARKDIGIFDPGGSLQRVFKAHGLGFTDVSSIIGLQHFAGDAVLFGPKSLGEENAPLLSFLKSRFGKGMNIVIFAHNEPYRAFGQHLVGAAAPARAGKLINEAVACAPGHPLLNDLGLSLSSWRGDGVIARTPATWPKHGNFRLLLEDGAKGEPLSRPLVYEILSARSTLVVCQIQVMEKVQKEPEAQILFRNIIAYVLKPKSALAKAAILAPPDDKRIEELRTLGLGGAVNPTEFGKYPIVVLLPEANFLKSYLVSKRPRAEAFERWLSGGGNLLIYGLNDKGLAELKKLHVFAALELQKVDPAEADAASRPGATSRDRTLWGFSRSADQRLYVTKGGHKMADCIRFQIFVAEGARQEVVYQERGITKTRCGRGAVIYCFYPYLELGEKERRSRLFRQLLTNVGCALDKADKHR